MFMKALESLGKLTDPMFGNIQPDDTVDIYYNLSTYTQGNQDNVQVDRRGPWNSEPNFRYITHPTVSNS
ncbi:manganese containing catalase [Calothrix brevissima NIES-22]|nr:manganese containing catalase [Calothrix brevissima NIES-22]